MKNIEYTSNILDCALYYSEDEATRMLEFADLDVDGFKVVCYQLPMSNFE